MTVLNALGEDFLLIINLDHLYKSLLEVPINKNEQKIPAFLFLNAHREFYLCIANYLRLHHSKSFCNLRSAIDSVLTAFYLLKYPDKKDIYIARIYDDAEKIKEWSKIFKNIKGTISKSIEEFSLVEKIIKYHEFCSTFAHSDAAAVLTRYSENKKELLLEADYFDYEETDQYYKKWLSILLIGFSEIWQIYWEVLFKELTKENKVKIISQCEKLYINKLNDFSKRYPFNNKEEI